MSTGGQLELIHLDRSPPSSVAVLPSRRREKNPSRKTEDNQKEPGHDQEHSMAADR